jgi:hypothetical protein
MSSTSRRILICIGIINYVFIFGVLQWHFSLYSWHLLWMFPFLALGGLNSIMLPALIYEAYQYLKSLFSRSFKKNP